MLGITHFSKGTGGRDPTERITGSIAFAALARVVLIAAKKTQVEDGEPGRMLARSKSNIGPDDGGFAYDLAQMELPAHPGVFASHVLWGNALEGSAREMLATADMSDDEGGGELEGACEFLSDLLRNGAVATKDIQARARDAGISWSTTKRAKKLVGVESIKAAMNSGWEWRLARRGSTNPEDTHQNSVSTFGKIEHLRESGAVSTDTGEVF